MVENSEQEEIKSLETKIKKDAFKVQTFSYPQTQKETIPDQISTCTKMFTLSKEGDKTFYTFDCFEGLQKYKTVEGIKEITEPTDLVKIYKHSFKMEEFISELANCLLDYKRETGNEFMNKLSKNYIDETLIETEEFLIDKKCFSKRTVNKAIAVLRQDPAIQVHKYYNLLGHRLISTENYYIEILKSLYCSYWSNCSDRMIYSNLAFSFAAVDFWDDHKGDDKRVLIYFERIKDRIRSLEKSKSEYIEFKVPFLK